MFEFDEFRPSEAVQYNLIIAEPVTAIQKDAWIQLLNSILLRLLTTVHAKHRSLQDAHTCKLQTLMLSQIMTMVRANLPQLRVARETLTSGFISIEDLLLF